MIAIPAQDSLRLDLWLWRVRVFKTRPLATEVCKKGGVEINGAKAKPARDVHPGELVAVRQNGIVRTLRVIAAPAARIGAKLVSEFYADLTPATEWEKLRDASRQRVEPREKGTGRPTKRDRRILDRLLS